MVGYGGVWGAIFTTTPMSFGMHMTAVGFGIGSWILAAIMKKSGNKLVDCMPEFGEGEEALEASKKVASGEAFKRQGKTLGDENESEAESQYSQEQWVWKISFHYRNNWNAKGILMKQNYASS